MQKWLVVVALAGSVSACATDADESDDAPSVVYAFNNCPDWKCGSNSPVIDNRGFHELNLAGEKNDTGFVLDSVTVDGVPYRIQVRGASIYLTNIGTGDVKTGPGVEGAILHVRHVTSNLKYDVSIVDATRAPMWARADGALSQTMTYQLGWRVSTYSGTNSGFQSLCSNPTNLSEPGMDVYHSVVFEGDRVDGDKIKDTAVDTSWINIGCAGSGLAKMHLTGHTEGAKNLGYVTTLAERTTMLKMLSADYCGMGVPFTVPGARLKWKDNKGWMTYSSAANTVEAHWGPDGAKCLDKPRLQANPTPLGNETFGDGQVPNIRAQVNETCPGKVPTCSISSTLDHLVSANPSLYLQPAIQN